MRQCTSRSVSGGVHRANTELGACATGDGRIQELLCTCLRSIVSPTHLSVLLTRFANQLVVIHLIFSRRWRAPVRQRRAVRQGHGCTCGAG